MPDYGYKLVVHEMSWEPTTTSCSKPYDFNSPILSVTNYCIERYHCVCVCEKQLMVINVSNMLTKQKQFLDGRSPNIYIIAVLLRLQQG